MRIGENNMFKKGDKVFNPRHGTGVVSSTYNDETYPIDVDFGCASDSYTKDGKEYDGDSFTTLFLLSDLPISYENFGIKIIKGGSNV